MLNEIPRQIKLWLDKNSIPAKRYLSLMPGEKTTLQGLLSVPRRSTTRTQLEALYDKLFFPERAGREATVDPVKFMPDNDLDGVFVPIPLNKTLANYEKY